MIYGGIDRSGLDEGLILWGFDLGIVSMSDLGRCLSAAQSSPSRLGKQTSVFTWVAANVNRCFRDFSGSPSKLNSSNKDR